MNAQELSHQEKRRYSNLVSIIQNFDGMQVFKIIEEKINWNDAENKRRDFQEAINRDGWKAFIAIYSNKELNELKKNHSDVIYYN